MPTTAQPVKVFCSYAHKDEELVGELKAHLSSLQRQQLISFWYDRRLLPGTDWAHEIDGHLNSATLILLLISSDFLASDYCYGIEMCRALERHDAHDARVVPILLRAVDWGDESIARLQALPTGTRPITSWSNRDEAFTNVAQGLRKVIADLANPVTSAPLVIMPPIWNVPFPRNPFFTGREDLLNLLNTQLQGGQWAAIGQKQVIRGLGGIGKTQLAIEYAYRYQQAYQAVLWASADSIEALNASYVELAKQLDLPEHDAKEQDVIVQAVKNWLQKHRAWLLILDNADQPELLIPFLPPVVGGHTLITTRATALGGLDLGITQPLALGTFTREKGALFLLLRSGRSAGTSEHEYEMARQISEELGDLPLALDQAGAYIEATGASLDTYMQLYQQRRAELLSQRRSRSHPDAVATTWSLSIQRIENDQPAAAELLRFCAFLAPDAIPEEIFSQSANHLGPILSSVAADIYKLNEALETLRAYSLINRDSRECTLSIHRLVQFVLRDSLSSTQHKQWEQRAVLALQAVFPEGNFENWSTCERLLPHALLYARWTGQTQNANLRAASLCFRAGYYLLERGRYTEAEQLHRHALTIRERLLRPDHPDVAVSLNSMGKLYVEQGKLAEAEPLFLSALEIAREVHGPDHPVVASGINNLAYLYNMQGKHQEAENLYQRALTIFRQQLGPDDPVVALYMNNLAMLYVEQEQLTKAESLLKSVLAITEQQLGPEHPQNASSLSNLAYLYANQGKFAEAELLFLRALAIEEKYLGPEHQDTAGGLYNLACVYTRQGKSREAEDLFQRALAIYNQTLGPDHPDTRGARELYRQLRNL